MVAFNFLSFYAHLQSPWLQPGAPRRVVVAGLIDAGGLLAVARAAVLGGGGCRLCSSCRLPLLLAARALDRSAPCRPLRPGARGTGERPTPLAELAQDILRGVSEGLRVPWTLGGWEGAMGSGTCRKAKLIKPLLWRLEEETAQEPVPGDSVKRQQCLALLKLEVAWNSGAGRLPLIHGQSKAVIGLPQRTLGPSLILCQMLTEGRVHAKLPAGHQGV